jgi:hypothetical protein
LGAGVDTTNGCARSNERQARFMLAAVVAGTWRMAHGAWRMRTGFA